jgi:uncharacterized protein (DUF1697 family)
MLRGINVGGRRIMKMAELKGIYESVGFVNVESYLQSGNIVFDQPGRGDAATAGNVETALRQSLGYEVRVLTRTEVELRSLVESLPFVGNDDSKVHVTFLYQEPHSFPTQEVEKVKGDGEEFHKRAREVYLFCPNGYGGTKMSNSFFERKLKVPATTRNWRTVNALLSMATSHRTAAN